MITAILASVISGAGKGVIEVDASQFGPKINPRLYGVFLEEINNAGEGGLYAELIQNRGFEDASPPPACTVKDGILHAPRNPSYWEGYSKNFTMEWPYSTSTPGWTLEGKGASLALTTEKPLTKASPHALKLDVLGPGAQVVNEGFWGMKVEAGEKYRLSLFAQNVNYQGDLEARLVGGNGRILASTSLKGIQGGSWSKLSAVLTAAGGDPKARFALVPKGKGTLLVDFVSLFPSKTFNNRTNGLRPDLAKMIADLRPGFIRWPGGCVVEGITIETRPRWEQTLGPLEERTPTFVPWGYWVSNGFGYHEWLQFCEDLGAEPLYVFSVGVSCAFRSGTFLPDSEMPALIQNTLDAIEYAIGPTTSKWGARRAKNGHPKPFTMKVVEIGNEEQGPKYGARVKLFTEAIKKKYPQIKVALSSWIAGIDHAAINAAGPQLDIVDEHAYKPFNWSIQNFDSFAKYPRNVPWKLYIGEFATNSGVGRGNMLAAVGDAAYMMSMEKNSDIVEMGSYAPLLENTNRRQWEVNMIHFDSHRAYGRAAYHACRMFAENLPTTNLLTKVTYVPSGENPVSGPVGLGTYGTEAEFSDIRVAQGGKETSLDDFSKWDKVRGRWTLESGAFHQSDLEHDRWSFFGDGFQDITVTLKARKIKGDEGFVISVGNADGRRVQFNVGGWGNQVHGIEVGGTPLKQVPGKVEAGRWHDVKVETSGRKVKCWLDGQVVLDVLVPRADTVLAIAGKDEVSGDIIIKALNPGSSPADMTFALQGVRFKSGSWTLLHSDDPNAENSYSNPRLITPVVTPFTSAGSRFERTLPPYSISILRLKTR